MLATIGTLIDGAVLSRFDAKLVRRSNFEVAPRQRLDPHRIVFFHPPKCGGSSITSALAGRFGANAIESRRRTFTLDAPGSRRAAEKLNMSLPRYREHLLAYATEADRYRFVEGHFPFSAHFMNDKCDEWDFLTILRNPLERMLSFYNFNRYKADREHFPVYQSLEDWLATADARAAATIFLRMFMGDVAKSEEIAGYGNDSAEMRRAIRAAIDNLATFRIVGDIANLDAFRARIASVYGVDVAIGRKNSNPDWSYTPLANQPEPVRARIAELCEPDMEIFRKSLGVSGVV